MDEIASLTGVDRARVEYRLQMESLELGWNVKRDAERFKVHPHRFDERMAALYLEGDGFIYETLTFWKRPYRQNWTMLALDRIRKLQVERPHVLLVGDGAGNDSLYLSSQGICVDYYDLPGSQTFNFAVQRFKRRGAGIKIIADREKIPANRYDAVISFEVLEHVPDPQAELDSISGFLRPGGIALITEAFSGITPELPTHLESNLRYVGQLPFMCAEVGLSFSWHGPGWKPWEFIKQPTSKLLLWTNPLIWKFVIFCRYRRLWNLLHVPGKLGSPHKLSNRGRSRPEH